MPENSSMRDAYLAASDGTGLPRLMYLPGSSLNAMLETDEYMPDRVYAVTDESITLLDEEPE